MLSLLILSAPSPYDKLRVSARRRAKREGRKTDSHTMI